MATYLTNNHKASVFNLQIRLLRMKMNLIYLFFSGEAYLKLLFLNSL